MFLKKLELVGFKSFADKTVLNFNDGITAVLGPNGSGKSNISDGIKWVLGEQSVKTLRGSSMEDIIFNGTAKRKALSRASVSITISNEKNILPIAFKEVTVTRRIFRSGESQYLINSSICRLKDVIELFMDTGLSKGSYSIIGQGQIGAILTANPYSRRSIFEEASGIVKYKNRKKIAFNKLEATKQDLLRVNDILLELERQLRSLKYQAAKAERYKVLTENLEVFDIYTCYLEFNKLTDEIEDVNREKKIFLDKKILLETQVNKQNSEYEEKKILLIEIDNNLSEVSRKMYEYSENIKNREYKILSNNGKIDNLKFQIKKYSEENNANVEKNKEFEISVKNFSDELIELENQLSNNETQISDMNEKISEVETELMDYETKLENLKNDIFVKASKTAENKNKLSSIETELKSLDNMKDELHINLAQNQELIYSLNSEIQIFSQDIVQLEETLKKLKTEIENEENLKKEFSEHIKLLQNKNDEYKDLLMGFKTELQVIIDTEDDKYIDSIKNLLQSLDQNKIESGFLGLIGEVIDTPSEYEISLGSALNDIIQTVIVDSNDNIRQSINLLKLNSLGKVKFVENNTTYRFKEKIKDIFDEEKIICRADEIIRIKDKKYNFDVIKKLFSDYYIVKDFETGYELSQKYKKNNFLTLEGEIFSSDGTITAGKVKETRNILKRGRQKKELSEKIETTENTILETNNKISDFKFRFETAEKNCLEFQSRLKKMEIELANKKNTIIQKEEQLIRVNEENDKINEKEKKILDRKEVLIKQIVEINSVIEKLSKDSENTKIQVNELMLKINHIKKQKEELTQNFTSFRISNAELKQKCENIKQSIKYYNRMKTELDYRYKENLRQIENCEINMQTLIEENYIINNELNENIVKKDKYSNEKQSIQSKREILNTSLMEIEKLTRSKGKEISSYLEKIHNFDILLSQRETKLENISDIIFDRYNINRNDFKNKIWIESFDEEKIEELKNKEISELKEEVKKLEAKIKSLGPVNINAIEEFKEVTERYDFLTSQKVDLEDATKDLNNVIQKINEKAKEKFLDTFEKVNENFKEIIKRLFNGGEAELSLIDPNDILETGIEINVRPPGKKIRNIMLLSGGEKAMAAVGLLFALFKVKPSPFCILDEIDAPLDDANIGRFLKLLKEFALNTQFVIVTHHKKTMAACDLLYGVTMEDKGISKILSVKLSDSKKIDELAG